MDHRQQLHPHDSLTNNHSSTKHLKEEFVSNLTGSSMLEIAALSFVVPALIVLRQWSCSRSLSYAKKSDHPIPHHKLWKFYVLSLTVDHLFVVLPMLTVFTVLEDWSYACAIILTFLMLFTLLLKRSRITSVNHGASNSSIRNSILSYRVTMMVVTCICILTVDFKIFPRRYAKTETYGTGLMDLGVGSFVVANALVSRQARNIMSMKLKSAVKTAGPLVLLGMGRLISTTSVDYQVHVGEYGVHWNFFFTLAAVSLLSSLVNIHPRHCGIFGLFVLLVHQVCLSRGMNVYLLSGSRGLDLISQNKEGLFSIFGYWAMYLIGVFLGYMVFFGGSCLSSMSTVLSVKIKVWALTIFFWLGTLILDKHVERVSRRMGKISPVRIAGIHLCNMAYVTLVFAQNLQVLSILMLSDIIPGQKPLVLEEAFNRNLLGSFLWANILTGIVNLYVDTLSTSSFVSFCILLGYSSILSGSVGLAAFFGIRLKFW